MRKTSYLKNKTIIVGCGRLGSSIANKCSIEGKNLMVIDEEPSAFERLSDRFGGYTITGDVTDLAILESAFITSAKEIIVTTGNDNINLFVAHVARHIYDVPHVYVRLNDPEMGVLLKGQNIFGIYPFDLSLDKFNIIRGGH